MAIEIVDRKKRYRAVIRINRKKVSKAFERKVDAEAWERRMLTEVSEYGLARSKALAPTISLDALRERFENEYAVQNQAPSTQHTERLLYRKHIGSKLGSRRLIDLTKHEIEKFFLQLNQLEGLSPSKINRIRSQLHGMFNRAVYWELISANPVSQTKAFKKRRSFGEQVIQYLTQDEAQRLLAWTKQNDPWLYPQVRTLLNTGIRFGEMLALRPQDVVPAPQGARLMISRSYCHHTYRVRNQTKGGASRIIPLGQNMGEFLLAIACSRLSDDPLFRESWEKCRHATMFRKRLEKAFVGAKVRRIRIHDLRHTYAVHFLERGGQLYDLQKLLGHSTIQLTERYSHFSSAMADRSTGLVDHDGTGARASLTVVNGGLRS